MMTKSAYEKKRTFSRAHMQMWAVLNMRAVRANFIARLYPSATVASILQLQVIINDEEQQRYQVASCLYERDALLERRQFRRKRPSHSC